MIADNTTFKGKSVILDGGSFYNCEFDGCILVFNGLLPVTLEGCSFNNCSWEFSGPARNTVNFMKALYESGATDLIENTFQDIRGEPTGRGPTLQ